MRIIAGEFKGRKLKTTAGPGYRPAMSKVRQAVFSMLEARGVVWAQTRVLDVFAGSGSLGFEALSRGAPFVCFVEADPKAARLIAENAKKFGLEQDRRLVCAQDARVFLASRSQPPFDLVFMDPPYRGNFLSAGVNALLRNGWIREGGILNAEVEQGVTLNPDVDFPLLECIADRTYGQTRVVLWTR